jgi:lipopolysaccharide heptosyltransferase II
VTPGDEAAAAAAPAASAASAAAAWRGVRRVLAVRLDNMGDLLMTTPALAALRDSVAGGHITLLASRSGTALAPHLPPVDEAIAFDAPWVRQPDSQDERPVGQAECALVDRLAAAEFDAAVIFTVATQSALPAALLCRMAGIPRRLAHARENPYGLLSDWVPETDTVADGMRHEVQRQLDLVRHVGCATRDVQLRFSPGESQRDAAHAQLLAAGLQRGERYVVLHVGATAASRRYPADRFGAVAREVARRSGHAMVFVGDGSELALVAEARAAMDGTPSINLAGRLSLGELGAVIGGAELLIANNSGPMHMAAAMGTPVVALYALTNPQHTPWQVPSRVLNHTVACRHCLKSVCPQGTQECLTKVAVSTVVEAALELLPATPARVPAPLPASMSTSTDRA